MERREEKKVEMICPKCLQAIEVGTTETMVYCIACRKWCREETDLKRQRPQPAPEKAIRKGIRCH